MTNEEVIEILESYMPKDEPMNARDRDAFRLAILSMKVLDKKPEADHCEDAVSRNYLLSMCYGYDSHYSPVFGMEPTGYAVDCADILSAPSVRPKAIKGRWIMKEDNTSFVRQLPRRWAECSCCGWSCDVGMAKRYGYCPDCGAKMAELRESEET